MTLKLWSETNFEGVKPLLVMDLLEQGRFDVTLPTPQFPPPPPHTRTCTQQREFTINLSVSETLAFSWVTSDLLSVNPSDKRLAFSCFGADFASAAPSCGTPDKLGLWCKSDLPWPHWSFCLLIISQGLIWPSSLDFTASLWSQHAETCHICLVDGSTY